MFFEGTSWTTRTTPRRQPWMATPEVSPSTCIACPRASSSKPRPSIARAVLPPARSKTSAASSSTSARPLASTPALLRNTERRQREPTPSLRTRRWCHRRHHHRHRRHSGPRHDHDDDHDQTEKGDRNPAFYVGVGPVPRSAMARALAGVAARVRPAAVTGDARRLPSETTTRYRRRRQAGRRRRLRRRQGRRGVRLRGPTASIVATRTPHAPTRRRRCRRAFIYWASSDADE